ncbi:MAG: hypothetical protein ACOC2E_05235 [Bacteroidota bacterium]
MYRNNRFHLLLLAALLVSTATFSQKRTYSPFSRYGLGELNTTGYGQNAAMGNTGIGLKSDNHLNILNPASYSGIDTMSFFFEAGISGFSQKFSSEEGKETYNNIDFTYFAMGFPISRKIHTSFGLRPFSNSGYKFEFSDDTNLNKAIGTGNLTSAYGGLSFKPSDNFSLGIHGSFLFGNIQHTTFIEFPDDEEAYKYGVQSELHASDFFFDLGAQYTQPISPDESLTVGLTFRPNTAIKGDFQRTVAKGNNYADDGRLFGSNYVIPEASDTSNISGFDMAQSLGVGLSYRKNDQLLLAADFVTSKWGDVTFPDGHTQTTNSMQMSAGAEYTPDSRSENYLSRMKYRGGVKFGEEYIQIGNDKINNFGITFGIGLPYNRSKTSVNLVFEYGNRKPTGNLDMTETYGKFTLNFTFHEFWFNKWKFQ